MHYACVVIILSNTSLYKSAFSTNTIGNLVYWFSTLFVLCWIEFNVTFINFKSFAFIINVYISIRYSVFLLSLVSKSTFTWDPKWTQTVLRFHFWSLKRDIWSSTFEYRAFNKRNHASGELFELLHIKNSISKGKCEIFTNWKSKRHDQQINFVKNRVFVGLNNWCEIFSQNLWSSVNEIGSYLVFLQFITNIWVTYSM